MNDAVKEIINTVLTDFKEPDALDRIAAHIIPRDDRPCGRWSLLNRFIVKHGKTEDARGFEQWNKLNRKVKKGCKALYILVPLKVPKESTDTNGKKKTDMILIGFKRFPVFRMEDTEGDPIQYPDFTPKVLPPLLNVAKTWGLDIKYGPDFFGTHALGYYGIESKDIKLMSHDVKIFFHELAHAGHEKVMGAKLKPGSDAQQEIVAEFVSCVLLRLYGFKGEGNAYDYIAHYAEADKKDVLGACTKVLSTVEKIMKAIVAVETGEDNEDADTA